MRIVQRSWKVVMFVLVASLFIVGCSSNKDAGTSDKGKDNGTTKKDQEMVIAVNENFISMDPHNTGDTNSNSVQSAMLEGLLGSDGEGKIIKQLAEDYQVSDDALEYSFTLKKDVKFHDGADFNAEVVKANFERIINDDSLRLYSRGFSNIDSIEVINDYEIKVTLKEPYSGMLTRFVSAKILSPELLEKGNERNC